MLVDITNLDEFGRGITRVNGKVSFVINALIDEEVEAEIIEEKNKYNILSTNKIIKKSIDRQDPKCPYYLICGGCNIMHLKYQKQLEYKYNKVTNLLKHFLKEDINIEKIIPSQEYNYRNKISLKVKDGHLGLYKNKSNDLVEIDNCLLCNEEINNTIKLLSNIKLNNISEIVIRSNYKNEILLALFGNNIDKSYYLDALNDINNIVIIDNKVKDIIKGNDFLIDKIGNKFFKVSLESFFQVNTDGVVKLYDTVKEYAKLTKKEKLLDLYCGTGTIGLYLSDEAKEVYGIEINDRAVEDAKENKLLNKCNNIDFLCSDVGKVKTKFKDIDLVVIDPPRSGLSNESLKNVLDINSKRIIYVSCDPVTLARDLTTLTKNYKIKEITLVDMFPNTTHCESIMVLERR